MVHLIAGNWKMNGVAASLREALQVAKGATEAAGKADVMICPPATLIERMRQMALTTPLLIGGQDCHANESGAHTGDISAGMLNDAGATAVIVGHSERRTDHGEDDATVRSKAEAAMRAGLTPIICIGETEAQRDAGETLDVLTRQLDGSIPDAATGETVIAYEPVWAIGTGRTASEDDIREAHAHIRGRLTARFGAEGGKMRILYGGSMKPANAAAILAVPEVNGGLVGGASLKAVDFLAIVAAATAT